MEQSQLDRDYLTRIGMTGRDYAQIDLDCEICGRHDFDVV